MGTTEPVVTKFWPITGLAVHVASLLTSYVPAGRSMSEDDRFLGSATAQGVIMSFYESGQPC